MKFKFTSSCPSKIRPSSRRVALGLISTTMLAAIPYSAPAFDRTWDGGGAHDNWNTINNWDNNLIPATTDNVIFGLGFGSGDPISLNGDRTAVTLAENGGTIAITGSNTLTVSGVISGVGSLSKTDTGTLALTGANTYSGTTTISGGTLFMGASEVLPNASDVTLSSSVSSGPLPTLASGGFSDTAGVFSLSGTGIKVIDLAGPTGSMLTFLSTTTSGWTGQLQEWNWTGKINQKNDGNQIPFTSYSASNYFTGAQGQFYPASGTGPIGYGAAIYANGGN